MLTQSKNILDAVRGYVDKKYVSFSSDSQKIWLDTDTCVNWLQDDSFFRNIIFYQSSLNEPIVFVLKGSFKNEVLVSLESRMFPNLLYWLTSLGYTPDFYTETFSETEKVLEPMVENMVTEILEEVEKIVDEIIEKVPVSDDVPVNTNQARITKKRKKE